MRTRDMLGKQDGFSMVELLIVMLLFVVVLVITMNTSSLIFKQSSQQAKTTETQMESVVGLDMLRLDIEQAGYGLPWSYPSALSGYSEATSAPASNYNDTASTAPRAVVGKTGLTTFVLNKSDYLVIKSTIAGMTAAAKKWSYIVSNKTARTWGTDDLVGGLNGDRIIAIRPKTGDTIIRQLVLDSASNFSTTYSTPPTAISNLLVQDSDLIYGVDSNSNLKMPFNRADYYVRRPASGVPSQCNTSTGVLYKATVNQSDGALTELPLLDCVAYMHVVLNLDIDDNGVPETFSNLDGTSVNPMGTGVTDTLGSADLLRKRLKEVRVFLLVQEGQKDVNYTYPSPTVELGTGTGVLKNFDLDATLGAGSRNYRWKVYTLVVKPKNLY